MHSPTSILAISILTLVYLVRVLLADWDAKNLDAAKQSLGQSTSIIRMDVSKLEDWTELKSKVVQEFGGRH